MSWLVPDSASYNDTGHFSTYNGDLYYNEDSWRLAKNMCWTPLQKWQQSLDLDSFYSTDLDFGFSKKFNGFTFKTSDEMPTLSQTGNETDIEKAEEPCKKLAVKTFTKKVKSYIELYKTTNNFRKLVYAQKNGAYKFNSPQSGYYYLKCISEKAYVKVNDVRSDNVQEGDTYSFYANAKDSILVSTYGSSAAAYELYFNTVVESFYTNARDASNDGNWGSGHIYYSNCDEMRIVCPGIIKSSSTKTADLTLIINQNSDLPIIAGVYVGGELKSYDIFSDLGEYSVKLDLSDDNNDYVGQLVVMYAKRYYDKPLNKNLRKEIEETLEYSAKTYYVSNDFSNTNISLGGIKNNYCIDASGITFGRLEEISKEVELSAARPVFENITVPVNKLPRINSIPVKDCQVLDWNATAMNDNFISPNDPHRVSGHFVATRAGTVTFKINLSFPKVFVNIRNNDYYINYSTIAIYKNGTAVCNHSSEGSVAESISVNKGDVIDVSTSGNYADSSYYSYEYPYAVVDRYFVDDENVTDKDNGFVVYKDNYNSTYSPAYDMAFIAKTEGTLYWSFGDVRNPPTSSSSDGILNIFVNGERRVRVDRDNSINDSLSLSAGDVVLIRYCSFTCSVGNKDNYEYVERGWDTPGGKLNFSYSGETTSITSNHTLSWNEYCKLILNEARLWVDDNSLTDYALPIAIIDDANNSERVEQFFNQVVESKLYVDLWCKLTNDVLSKCYIKSAFYKCINLDMQHTPITASFDDCEAVQVRVKDATSGTNAFADFNKTIKQLELVDISGNWDYAFRNSTIEKLDFGTFRTKGLTSAYCMFKDCDLHYLTEDVIKTFFNDTYDKWYKGYISFRSAFIGSINSGTVPEAYMSIDDQYDCNWDPATLIQNVVSTYDVNILPLGYHFYGHPNYTDASRLFLSSSSTVHTVKVEARHYNETTDQAAQIYIDGKLLKSNGERRGHFICVIDCKTKEIKFEKQVDTFGEPTSADSVWTEVVDLAGENDIIVATSWDATSLTQAARDIIDSAGGTSSVGTWTQQRVAHAFIGKKGVGTNNGFEMSQSGSEYSVIEASFDENRGLIHRDWESSSTFGLSPVYEKVDEYPIIRVEEAEFWKWGPVFSQIKDCYDYAGFSYTSNNKANFDLDVLTSGDEKQVNPNYETSLGKAVEANTFDNLILHLRKVENTTDKNISIEGMFKNIKNLHCVGEIKNIQDITSAFEGCDNIIEVSPNLNNVEIADYAFKNCDSLKTITVFSNSCFSAMHMFEDCDALEDFDISGMTSLIDGTSMFENCDSLKTDFTKPSKLPNNLQIARKMFAGCNVKEISGTWIPPNTYTSYRNQYENGIGNLEDEWTNEVALSKEGWTFPEQLSDAYMMFKGNPITKISNLSFNPNANNSWIFQDCNNLIIIKDSYLNIDTFDDAKYTGMFDGCSLKKENVLWLPVSISSKFDLKHTGITYDSNEKPIQYLVDDHWCEVDNSGFVEYQHIRRPKYLQVYKDNGYDDILIKFWSHPHIHSAEMRGYNELHDTKVYYDPESLHGGLIDYNKWLRKD